MKTLLVDIKAIVGRNSSDAGAFTFEKAVVTDLYRIQRLGYSLSLIIDDTLLNEPFVQQALSVLSGEFQFGIINKTDVIGDYDFLVEKIDEQFIIKSREGTKACADWNEILSLIKSSARK